MAWRKQGNKTIQDDGTSVFSLAAYEQPPILSPGAVSSLALPPIVHHCGCAPQTAPVLSIVIATCDRPYWFGRCLQAIQMTTHVPYEVVVVDGSLGPVSPSETVKPVLWEALVQHEHNSPSHGFAYLRDERKGFSQAYNKGFREARGKYVVWLNDDAEPQAGWAEIAVAFMNNYPQVGLGALHWCDHQPPYVVQKYHGVIYANFGIVRREVGDRLGWFDEAIHNYGSDTALSLSVIDAGITVAPVHGANILHHRAKDALRNRNEACTQRDGEAFHRGYEAVYKRALNAPAALKGIIKP